MTSVLIVDDSSLVTNYVAQRVADELGWQVTVASDPDEVEEALAAAGRPDLAVVDLSFPPPRTGLDVLLHLQTLTPATRLVVYTQGDGPAADLLRDAWHAAPLAAAVSKGPSVEQLLAVLQRVERGEPAWVDPVLRPHVPNKRSPWRTPEAYARLVVHAGHAKLWRALIELPDEPSYDEIAEHADVDPKTIRNYRQELLAELALHGLDRPAMRHMQVFARRCRPLLELHMRPRLKAVARR